MQMSEQVEKLAPNSIRCKWFKGFLGVTKQAMAQKNCDHRTFKMGSCTGIPAQKPLQEFVTAVWLQ